MTQRILFALTMAIVSTGVAAARTQEGPPSAPLVERPRLRSSSETVVMSFQEDVSLNEVFLEIGEQADVIILFDESFRDQRTRVDLGRVSVGDALAKLTNIHRLFYKVLDSTTVIIIPDNAQKHRQYDEMLLHTFYVEHNDANAVANMFRTLAGIQRVHPDPVQKSVTVRATADQLLVAQSVLERNDSPPAEISLQVEILAVDLDSRRLAERALTSDEFVGLKNGRDAELMLEQSIRLTDNERGTISIGEVGTASRATQAADAGVTEEPLAESPRAFGLRLSFQPRVFRAGGVQLSLELEATAPAADDTQPSPRRLLNRDVATSLSIEPGEVSLHPVMFRVDELGAALPRAGAADDARDVVVAIGVTVLRPAERREVLPPLPMGTEQQVRVPLR